MGEEESRRVGEWERRRYTVQVAKLDRHAQADAQLGVAVAIGIYRHLPIVGERPAIVDHCSELVGVGCCKDEVIVPMEETRSGEKRRAGES